MSEHEITVRSETRLYSTKWWRARCTCGKYMSGLHGSPGRAEQAGRDHVNAKNRASQ